MSYKKHHFKQSIKYSFQLREAPFYAYYMRQLVASFLGMKVENFHPKYKLAFTDAYKLRHCKSVKPEKNADYTLKNLTDYCVFEPTRVIEIPSNKKYKTATIVTGFSLAFKNKTACKDFLKFMNIKPEDVFVASWIDKAKRYNVSFRFKKSLFEAQYKHFKNAFEQVTTFYENRYKVKFSDKVAIPSSIYDRWFDPFTGKTLWNTKEILSKTKHKLDIDKVYKQLSIAINRINSCSTNGNSCVNYFIENSSKIANKKDLLRQNLYIVNHYINEKNPYKRRDARRDWKFAAEQYLNEVLAKFYYKNTLYKNEFNSVYDNICKTDPAICSRIQSIESTQDLIDNTKGLMNRYKDVLAIDPAERTRDDYLKAGLMYRDQFNNETIEKRIKDFERSIENLLENVKRDEEWIKKNTESKVKEKQDLIKKNKDSYLLTFFSKKETELFLRKLNLKTKIVASKLRKAILDFMLNNSLIEIKEDYVLKTKCRLFKLCPDSCRRFYHFISKKIKYISKYYFYILIFINKLKRKNGGVGVENHLFWKYAPKYITFADPPN